MKRTQPIMEKVYSQPESIFEMEHGLLKAIKEMSDLHDINLEDNELYALEKLLERYATKAFITTSYYYREKSEGAA